MLSIVALAPLNHILLSENWAKRRLQSHTGKTIQICVSPFLSTTLTVQESGELLAVANNSSIDATATFTFSLLPRLLTHDEGAYSEISISGDDTFAEELIYISKNLHWDVEQELSKITGDIFAHRIVQTGQDIKCWHSENTENLSAALAEYWLEEQPLLAKSSHVKEFISDVNELSNDMEQLETRVEKISMKNP
jgi:ubiquinone biosynthesis accessory factor UbiJ